MQSLTQLLSKKYRFHFQYSRALEVITKQWEPLLKGLANHLRPDSIYKNILIIHCSNPVWMSEIDYFSSELTDKVNDLLKLKKIPIKIKGVKAVLKAEQGLKVTKINNVPDLFIDRIKWNINEKKERGEFLCQKCEKVWDKAEVCRLCQLTSS